MGLAMRLSMLEQSFTRSRSAQPRKEGKRRPDRLPAKSPAGKTPFRSRIPCSRARLRLWERCYPGLKRWITHGSHAAIDAILAGVPAIVLGPGRRPGPGGFNRYR